MLNTDDSRPSFSLDALLGVQPEVEGQPDEAEARLDVEAGAPPVDLLSMLGLAVDGSPSAEEQPFERDTAPAVSSDAPADNLRTLLGLGEEERRGDAAATSLEPEKPVAPLALDALTVSASGGAVPAVDVAPLDAALTNDASLDGTVSNADASKTVVRSRFADAPAFRSQEGAELAAVAAPPASSAEPVAPSIEISEPTEAPERLAMPLSAAAKFLAGEPRLLALPEHAQVRKTPDEPARKAQPAKSDRVDEPATEPKSAKTPESCKPATPAKPTKSEEPVAVQLAKPSSAETAAPQADAASARQSTVPRASAPAPAKPTSAKPAPAKPAPVKPTSARPAPAKPKPAPASKAPAAKPVPSQAATPSLPIPTEHKVQPEKHGNGLWYLLSACLFALAIVCTCYAVYAAAHDGSVTASSPIAATAEDETGEQRYRYSVQGVDGEARTVEETARFGIDGLVAESVVSFDAESEEEAAQVLEDAKTRFGEAWMSGAVQEGKAVFTVAHEGEGLDRDAYTALLESNTLDCETMK